MLIGKDNSLDLAYIDHNDVWHSAMLMDTTIYLRDPITQDTNMTSYLTSSVIYSKRICTMTMQVNIKHAVNGYDGVTIGTLPDAVRPSNNVRGIGIIEGSGNAVMVDIAPTGLVSVWGFGANVIKDGTGIQAWSTWAIGD